jgi:UDP-GlcNAc:undecaprenyl-phosphate/decaprenyl-phosphate GlcNAc-1-phosphate transferase
LSYLTVGLLSCLVTLLLLTLVAHARRASRPTNLPHRPRETFPSDPPRVGGLSMVAAVALSCGVAALLPIGTSQEPARGLLPALTGGLLVFLVGWIDDIHPVPPLIKLWGQVCAASVSYLLGLHAGFFPAGWLNYAFTVFCLTGGANALNLIDGLDGLAGAVAAVAAGVFFFMARDLGNAGASVLAASLAAASLAFLWFNLPPARVFMGDAGSNFLGFGLAAVPFLLSSGHEGFSDFSAAMVVLAVPIAETATSIGRRVFRGRSPLTGDLEHIHHHLWRRGWPVGAIILLFAGATCLLALPVFFRRQLAGASIDRSVLAWLGLGALLALSALFVVVQTRPVRRPESEKTPGI